MNLDKYLDFFDFLDSDIPGAMEIYRQSNEAFNSGDIALANKLYRLNYLLHGSSIPARARIGRDSTFAYGGIGVVIHEGATLGARCNIGANVTVGGTASGVPIIEDDCYLSTGCKILGNIRIGKCSVIGAGAIVVKSIPPFSVVMGVPGEVKQTITPENFHKYQDCFWCKNKPDSINAFIKYHWK
jgi:serine O-acetyltransferase